MVADSQGDRGAEPPPVKSRPHGAVKRLSEICAAAGRRDGTGSAIPLHVCLKLSVDTINKTAAGMSAASLQMVTGWLLDKNSTTGVPPLYAENPDTWRGVEFSYIMCVE